MTLKQKTEIHDYKMKFPDLSFETFGKTFSEKWGKNISKITTIRSYHLIKNPKENGLEQVFKPAIFRNNKIPNQ